MADDLEEELGLDVGPALAQVDRLEARLAEVATRSSAALSKALADGVTKATASLPTAKPVDIPVQADTASLDELSSKVADLSGLNAVQIPVDGTQAGRAAAQLDQLDDAIRGAQRQPPIFIPVDARGVQDARREIAELVKDQENAGSRLEGVGRRMATALVGGSALKAGYDRITTIQDATAALTVSLGDATKAKQLLDQVLGVVTGTPFALDRFAAAAQQMAGVGVEASKIPAYLEAIGEASATQGKRANEYADRLSTVFSQVAASGQIQLIDVWRISDTGVNALAILANEFGVTRDEMKDMISEGAVPAGRALDALARGIVEGSDGVAGSTKALGGTMDKLGEQLSGAAANTGTAAARAVANTIEPLSDVAVETLGSVTDALDSVGKAGGGIAGLLAKVLGNDLVAGATRGGAAVLLVVKGLQGLLGLTRRVAGGLGSVSDAAGLRGLADRLNLFAGGARAAGVQLGRYEQAMRVARQASTELAAGVEAVSSETALGAAVHQTYARMVAAQAAAQKAATVSMEADAAVRKARQAVLSGEAGAVARLDAALAAQTAAQQAVATTAAEAAAAESAFSGAVQRASVANVEGATSAASLATANTAAAASAQQASGALSGIGGAAAAISAPLLAVAAVVTTVAIAVKAWQDRQAEAQAIAGAAADAFDGYAESLHLTNSEIASLDPDKAARMFEQSTARVQAFKDALSAEGVDLSLFRKANLDNADLQAALNGSEEAANRLKGALVDTQSVTAGDPLSLGKMLRRAFDDSGKVDDWVEGERKREAAAIASARAIARTNDAEKLYQNSAAQTTVQNVLASRASQQLTDAERTRLQGLLVRVDAMKRDEEQTSAVSAAVQSLSGHQRELYQAALDGDLGAARAFAASDAYESLDTAARKPIDSLLKQADAAMEAAQANQLLVSSSGEVVATMAGLSSALDSATSKYLSMSGAQASLGASNRNVRAAIDGVGEAIRTHGKNVDDANASIAAGAITVDNYREILATLPRAVRLRIESIGVDKATKEVEDFAEAVDRAADATASAEDKLLSIRREQAEASYRAQQRAKKIARGELDDLGPAEFTPDFSSRIARAERDLERARRKEADVRAGRSDNARTAGETAAAEEDAERRRAAATAAAVRSGQTTAATGKLARDNARAVADAWDQAGSAIRRNGIDMLNSTRDVGQVQATMQANAQALGAEAKQAFMDMGMSAGDADAKVHELLSTQRLLPDQIKVDFQESGIDRIVSSIDRLSLLLAGLAGIIPPDTLTKLLSIDGDPEEQVRLLNEEINKLPQDQQVIIRSILNLDQTSAEQARAQAEQIGRDPVEVAIEMGVAPEDAQRAKAEIDEIAKKRKLDVRVDADTIAAVAELDKATAQRVAEILAKDPNDSAGQVRAILDDAAKKRTAIIEAHVRFVPESGGDSFLLNKAQELELRGASASGGGTRSVDNIGSSRTTSSSSGSSGDWQARKVQVVNSFNAQGKTEQAKAVFYMSEEEFLRWERAISGGVGHRAKGGPSGVDDDTLRRLLGSDRKASAGLNAAGSYRTVTSEDGTGGEWVISRDPAVRSENQRLARLALEDLGGARVDVMGGTRLAATPMVQVAAPNNAEMVGELRRTAGAVGDAVGRLDGIAAAAARQRGGDTYQITEARNGRQTAYEIAQRKKAEAWRAQAPGI